VHVERKILLKGTVFIMLVVGFCVGDVWTTSHADVDGDGIDEGIDYVIGEEGEQNIPYVYAPHAHFIAWNTSRTCMGVAYLRQVLFNGAERLLDTGEPTLIGQNFYYVDKLYDSMTSFWNGNNVVTRWVSQKAILERIVNLNDARGVNRYRLWQKNNDGSTTFLGETGFLAVWNDGMTTIEQARNYVLGQIQNYKNAYNDSFPGIILPNGIAFKVIYIFDDYLNKVDNFSILGWDGWNYNTPSSPAIWGMLHLPEPCSLTCEYFSSPCSERAYVLWKAPTGIKTAVRIEPEVINLKSHGKFTAFITLPSGYNHNNIDLSTVECEGAHAISGHATPEFYIAKFNIQDLVGVIPGPAVEFRVSGALYDGTPFYGVDTVRVINNNNLIFLTATPNPFKDNTIFAINTDGSLELNITRNSNTVATIKIYNEAGRLVKILKSSPSNFKTIMWNGEDDTNKEVPSGVYFCKLELNGYSCTQKIIVLK